jgi:hypothetical protein
MQAIACSSWQRCGDAMWTAPTAGSVSNCATSLDHASRPPRVANARAFSGDEPATLTTRQRLERVSA